MPLAPEDGIRELARLRRIQERVDPETRDDLERTIALLLTAIGPTVKRSVAARVLGIRQPALDKWIRSGEIATLQLPSGRQEVPVGELLDILEDFDAASPEHRPLAAAIRRRRERTNAAMPVDLLPWAPDVVSDGHRRAELRSLAYHRAVARRLTPAQVESARRRVNRWKADGRIHPKWAEEWERVLDAPLARIVDTLGEDTPWAADLRQSSPFAGTLSDYERRRLLRAVEATVS